MDADHKGTVGVVGEVELSHPSWIAYPSWGPTRLLVLLLMRLGLKPRQLGVIQCHKLCYEFSRGSLSTVLDLEVEGRLLNGFDRIVSSYLTGSLELLLLWLNTGSRPPSAI